MTIRQAALVLADGTVFEGDALGYQPNVGVASGEVVFNTAMSGYQEIITDPSYAGQIITFTYPHIGNYGVNLTDFESRGIYCRGIVIREMARRDSNYRSQNHLDTLLQRYNIAGIGGIDTRRLTRHLRDRGAMSGAFGTANEATLLHAANTEPGTAGIDLATSVSTRVPYTVGAGALQVVAYDFGLKHTILRHLAQFATVHVVPAGTSAAEVLAHNPDGVFLSNGPGDPVHVVDAAVNIRALLDSGVPMFGICLGHQLMGLALGADIVKLPFGHHGANHPVKNLVTNHIEITSQNHNFAVDIESLTGVAVLTHVNLNDGVCEGMSVCGANAFSVQHHPEAGPGPHESAYLFRDFFNRIASTSSVSGWLPELPYDLAGLPMPEAGVA